MNTIVKVNIYTPKILKVLGYLLILGVAGIKLYQWAWNDIVSIFTTCAVPDAPINIDTSLDIYLKILWYLIYPIVTIGVAFIISEIIPVLLKKDTPNKSYKLILLFFFLLNIPFLSAKYPHIIIIDIIFLCVASFYFFLKRKDPEFLDANRKYFSVLYGIFLINFSYILGGFLVSFFIQISSFIASFWC